ncbi:antibiotic ABC transporter [Paracoccus suum]|uniref:Antibiotic ABC transporter n=1 Tax=Paracoccus suum TaxID=2259340 RepID=A0A344PIB9_9RHOB|nr:antibiotic ABC transporter [Paracoccus suum]AXC49124.1 antibiotic ABC transporter [Paracoccus suum]
MNAVLPLTLWSQMATIGWESQMVICMRSAAMLGLLPQAPDEVSRMITEKQDAAKESLLAAMRAASSGKRADQVLEAALSPYARRTHANAKRLTKAA